MVVDEENLVIGFGPLHFRNASAIAYHTPEMNFHFCPEDKNENWKKRGFIAARSCELFHCL